MTRRVPLWRRVRHNERGVAIVEYALTAPIFLLLLLGIFDYTWQMYTQQVLDGAVAKAARDATLEENIADQAALDNQVRDVVQTVMSGSEVTFVRKAYDSFEEVGDAEPYTDSNKNESYDAGECFEDINGNGRWDADRGRDGNGGADDVVLYTASVKFDRVLPVWKMLGQPQQVTLSASTVLRNQPFNAGADANPVQCR
ncbi:MAG: TadE/TadG family type IV pilus assembly protein [Sphingopyxis sp.]|uniref:TadE/TadG family type IV pilus assembly protein n=1 Tax=Sphingopyxis sp. TaxID=1908224 RepID=UPI002ABB2BD7|nr:TadE/TadG family type IV pilus assembly protein [Sphingopyxis sp.]MDZ3830560.1 TadE/TadG family type IV pilus assembly protein [Sphingopyxis sp.]